MDHSQTGKIGVRIIAENALYENGLSDETPMSAELGSHINT
jgi:hypothetical protein